MATNKSTLNQADINLITKGLIPQIRTVVSLVIIKELSEQEEKFEEKLTEFKSDFFERVDPILKEVTTAREERKIVSRKLTEHTNQLEKINKHLGLPTQG